MCKPSPLRFQYYQDEEIKDIKYEIKIKKAKIRNIRKKKPEFNIKLLDFYDDIKELKARIKELKMDKKHSQLEAKNEGLLCKYDGINYFWKNVKLFLLDCENNDTKWLSEPGVYLIVNKRTEKSYCGRTIVKLSERPKKHFLGGGNPDIKKDYENGDKFVIHAVGLSQFTKDEITNIETIGIEAVWENRYNRKKGDRVKQ